MGTLILLNNEEFREFAIFDYTTKDMRYNFYPFRDKHTVHNENSETFHKHKSSYGTQLTVPEWIAKYGVPPCLERIYDSNGGIPF